MNKYDIRITLTMKEDNILALYSMFAIILGKLGIDLERLHVERIPSQFNPIILENEKL